MIEFTTTKLLSVCDFDDAMVCFGYKNEDLHVEWSFKSNGYLFVFSYTLDSERYEQARDKRIVLALEIETCRGAMLHMVKSNIYCMTLPNPQPQ